MKQLQSERVFLNMAGKESSQTVRLTLHLQDDVDGAILKEAVEATRQRYPYHQVRLCTRGDEQGIAHYAFDDNPLPWVVTAGRQMAEFPDKNDQKNRPRDYHVITIILNIYGSFGGKVTTYFVTLQ